MTVQVCRRRPRLKGGRLRTFGFFARALQGVWVAVRTMPPGEIEVGDPGGIAFQFSLSLSLSLCSLSLSALSLSALSLSLSLSLSLMPFAHTLTSYDCECRLSVSLSILYPSAREWDLSSRVLDMSSKGERETVFSRLDGG